MATPIDIEQMLIIIMAALPSAKVRGDTSEIYYQLLKDLPADLLRVSVLEVLSTWGWSYLPPPAAIRKAALGLQEQSLGLLTGGEAWSAVARTIREFGWYREEQAEKSLGPLVWDCVQALGGWSVLCQSENQVADRAHFLKIYDQHVDRERKHLSQLPEVRAANAAIIDKKVRRLAGRLAERTHHHGGETPGNEP